MKSTLYVLSMLMTGLFGYNQTDYATDFQAGIADFLCVRKGETIPKPAQLVAFEHGTVSLETKDSSLLAVVTSSSFHKEDRYVDRTGRSKTSSKKRIPVVLLGKTTVLVQGQVHFGDFLIPSGENNGMAIAMSPTTWKKEKSGQPVFGIAWSSHPFDGTHLVEAHIGPWNQEAILKLLKQFYSKNSD